MPPRVTRSKVSPGLVDRPNPRRSSTVVAEEKAKKKSAAALKAEDQRRRAAQVAEVEKQIKTAQVEEQQVGRRGGGKVIKKTFQRPNPTKVDQGKRDAETAELSPTTATVKVTRTAELSSVRSRQASTPNKPAGLSASMKATTIHLATTAANEDEEPNALTEEEEEEVADDLEYSAGSKDSLVSISSVTAPSTTSVTASTPRCGVRSLPPNVQRSFSNDFIPCIITEMGCSMSPWSNLDVDTVQGYVNFVYLGYDYAVDHGDGFHASSNSRIMTFRNKISTTALANVQSYLARYTPGETEDYVRSALLYYGEVPFLYRVFDPTNVRSSKEKGGYKVIRHGIFQHPVIVDTMLVYYGKRGTKACIPTASVPGENPIGALALVCTAVERALCMHTLGHFVEDGHSFSEKTWGHRTAVYLKLAKDMNAAQWAGFYGMLRVHEGIQEKMEEFIKPAVHWSDDPDEYFILGSEPEE